jgi:hypothetical protein
LAGEPIFLGNLGGTTLGRRISDFSKARETDRLTRPVLFKKGSPMYI